jgi:Cellulose binding domain
MAGQYQAFISTITSRRRLLIGVASVLVLFLVVGLVALLHRDNDRSPLAGPAAPIFPNFIPPAPVPVLPAPVADSSSAIPSGAASASVSPSSGVAASRASASRASASRASASRSAATTPKSSSPAQAFSARYVITNNRGSTFQAGVFLTNNSNTARNWQVSVTHDPAARVRVQEAFGARISTNGDTTVFSGGPLGAGDSIMFGFQADKNVRGVVRPTSCRVDGRNCVVTVH